MPTEKEDYENRIKSLEQEVNLLKKALGQFANGLDKVSQVQANLTVVTEGLIQANETNAHLLKRLVDTSERNNKLVSQNTNMLKKFIGKKK